MCRGVLSILKEKMQRLDAQNADTYLHKDRPQCQMQKSQENIRNSHYKDFSPDTYKITSLSI